MTGERTYPAPTPYPNAASCPGDPAAAQTSPAMYDRLVRRVKASCCHKAAKLIAVFKRSQPLKPTHRAVLHQVSTRMSGLAGAARETFQRKARPQNREKHVCAERRAGGCGFNYLPG